MNYNEILKPFTEAPAINIGGYFAVADNNKRNLLTRKDVNADSILRAVVTVYPELLNDAEKLNVVKEMIVSEMNANVKTR